MCTLVIACGSNMQHENVYVDNNGYIHVDNKCSLIPWNSQIISYGLEELSWKELYNNGDMLSICTRCTNGDVLTKVRKKMNECTGIYESIREERLNEYNALCLIGKCRWYSLDDYFWYVYDDDNKRLLNKELMDDGWRGLHSLSRAYKHINIHDRVKRTKQRLFLWSESFINYIYLNFNREDIIVGSLNDFKEELKSKDGFVWCYEMSLSMGLVDDWEMFIKNILEPDYDYCKEFFGE